MVQCTLVAKADHFTVPRIPDLEQSLVACRVLGL